MAEIAYKRLTRARLRSAVAVAVASRSSLWLGPDHLLQIDSTGYNERYKRFFFRDIQAFVVTMTQRRRAWNWALAILMPVAAVLWALYFNSEGPGTVSIILAIATGLAIGIPLFFNNMLGPTCTCHVRTAVQVEQLWPLNRLPRAQSVLDQLRPLIVATQGSHAVPDSSVASRQDPEATGAGSTTAVTNQPRVAADDIPPQIA